jgi:DNA-binding transcriptional LysR family regulator
LHGSRHKTQTSSVFVKDRAARAPTCRRFIDEVKEAERGAPGEYSAPQCDLTVTAPIVFGRLHVLPLAIAFLKAYRDVNIRFVVG